MSWFTKIEDSRSDFNSEYPQSIVDMNNIAYRLEKEPLGIGGQGVVFRTLDKKVAIKLLMKDGKPIQENDGTIGNTLRKKLEMLRVMPIPEKLHLARPASMIKPPYIGYIMRFLSDMVPISSLIFNPQQNGEKLSEFYQKTGGLSRRLAILHQIASILAQLHAVPLVYADISFNNIFISNDPNFNEVWLIDADNLHYATTQNMGIYTPGFGAPEIVQGKSGVNTISDIYAFAILAFHILAQQHPFLGDYVENGGSWSQTSTDASNSEDKAYRGELPWIDDSQDDSNHTEHGIPRSIVLSSRLKELFQKTFEEGRLDPLARPSMSQWWEALLQAQDMAISCPKCKQSFYANNKKCPWCDTPRSSVVAVRAYHFAPELDENAWDIASGQKVEKAVQQIIPSDNPQNEVPTSNKDTRTVFWQKVFNSSLATISKHVTTPFIMQMDDCDCMEIEYKKPHFVIRALDSKEYWVVQDKFCERIDGSKTIIKNTWHVHCGKLDQHHRVLSFRYISGEEKQ